MTSASGGLMQRCLERTSSSVYGLRMTRSRSFFAPLVLTLAALSVGSGCREDDGETARQVEGDTSQHSLTDGTPPAIAVLNLLNDCKTSQTILDDRSYVGLDVRAATSLTEHRDGGDGQCGTKDDDLYDNIAEVDDQYFVGGKAIGLLEAYATSEGYLPGPDDFLVQCDDVDFTVREADITVAFVNGATVTELDAIPYVQPKTAQNLVDDAPHASVLSLCKTSGVGKGTLTRIKTAALEAAPPDGIADGEACAQEQGEPNPCVSGLTCNYDAGAGCGFCVNTKSTSFNDTGNDCQSDSECDTGVCAGTTVYGGNGYCQLPWMRRTFTVSEPGGLAIPAGGTLSVQVPVCGLASVPEDMVLQALDITGDLAGLKLTWDADNGSTDEFFDGPTDGTLDLPANILGIERDNSVNNLHKLHIENVGSAGAEFFGLEILISSRYD